ncbi:FAD-dependent monooxygenase [Paenibacillus glycanilyticus]|uniref:NAD(P)/FAD-dependent oxidoreductase n=1 Tax=Paenibacillus glycanilyticus TaxID=126569 RepID=UPI00203F63A4|nr:FAD-dependent monooxygenase [Paenibacillus glycanilyticus]MCM3627574.1 FAD-dependent monooxygenase [Paenibacillus glycanilyticus]
MLPCISIFHSVLPWWVMNGYDVIVVGAGPSGSALAKLLAASGVRVLMLDAEAFPRRKPCGESLNPGAVAALGRIMGHPHAEESFDFPHSPIEGWRVISGRASLEAAYPAGQYGVGCRRERVDQWLVEHAVRAGAAFEQRTRVERLIWEGERVAGVIARSPEGRPISLRASIVAGSDGLRSVVARHAKVNRYGSLRKAAFTTRLNGVSGLTGRVELFTPGGGKVIGLAPIGGGQANMTVALSHAHEAALAGKDRSGYVLREARAVPELMERLREAEIEGDIMACGPFDRPVLPHDIAGMVLLGDAAGYYDPLTGQGIYRALRSAELAAPAIVETLRTRSPDPIRRYGSARQEEFATGTRLQHIIERISRQPLLWRTALRMIGASSLLTNKLAIVIGDCPKEAKTCIPVMKSP